MLEGYDATAVPPRSDSTVSGGASNADGDLLQCLITSKRCFIKIDKCPAGRSGCIQAHNAVAGIAAKLCKITTYQQSAIEERKDRIDHSIWARIIIDAPVQITRFA